MYRRSPLCIGDQLLSRYRRDEMLAVKKRFGKENGTVAYHGYQSFAPGEVTPETAHEIGMKLAAVCGATVIR